METDYWLAPLHFIVHALATLATGAVMLRLILQLVRADYYNPICQFLVKTTQPVLRPMRRMIPSVGRFDTASLVLMLLLQIAAVAVLLSLQGMSLPSPAAIGVLAVMRSLELAIDLYVGVIIGSAVISWVAPHSHSPLASLLYSLSEPLLQPARRLLPAIGGLDLSPIAVLMALELARMLLLPPLQQLFRLVG
ncbi:YggT family protein [Methylogaea oryzae]|uniref:Membrane protein n=1 Tax=Methylogaea oryzae TaxID=1295382 RepID=A0A8D4VLP4_9GAMM|nr:YggT family protein [Methylogaea oryzae]BBL69422.1 membrane protein [Methylogaea oryzae]